MAVISALLQRGSLEAILRAHHHYSIRTFLVKS
jgi:hypothetical protein